MNKIMSNALVGFILDDVSLKQYLESRNAKLVNKDDVVDVNCGVTVDFIFEDELKEMMNGKYFFFDDGEYTHLIGILNSR